MAGGCEGEESGGVDYLASKFSSDYCEDVVHGAGELVEVGLLRMCWFRVLFCRWSDVKIYLRGLVLLSRRIGMRGC